MTLEPKPVLTVVVMANAAPWLSTTARWVVPWSSGGVLLLRRWKGPPYTSRGCTLWSDVRFLQQSTLVSGC